MRARAVRLKYDRKLCIFYKPQRDEPTIAPTTATIDRDDNGDIMAMSTQKTYRAFYYY